MGNIVLLGGNKLNQGFELTKKKLNIDNIIVIDWNKCPDYIGDICYQVDIKDYDAIIKLGICWSDVLFVYTSADIAVETQIRLHRNMGLLSPSDESIKNALIKGKSRDCWEKDGILNKYSVVIKYADEFVECGFDKYIFKPNCSSGSRNITILNKNELSYKNIVRAVECAKEVSVDNKCIVEEFVDGVEYTIDMLGDDYGNVGVFGISKKYHTPYNTQNKIATKLHYAPPDEDRNLLEKIASFGQKCYKSIGLKNSFGHLEVIVSNSGKIVPVEIGARSSGFIATILLDLINDVLYLDEYRRVLSGEKVKDGLTFDGSKSSMYYFYDIKPGISSCSTNIMNFLPMGIQSYASDRSNLMEGKIFNVVNADHERYGFEILGGSSEVLNIKNINEAEKNFNNVFVNKEK